MIRTFYILIATSAFLAGKLLAQLSSDVSTPQGKYIIDDNFNKSMTGSFPDDWILSKGKAVITEIPFPSDKSIRIETDTVTSSSHCHKDIPSLKGHITIELKTKTHTTSGTKYIPCIYDADKGRALAIAFHDGNIAVFGENEMKPIQAFKPDVWYIIRIVINTETKTFDLYVDGIKKLSKEKFQNPVDEISNITCTIENSNHDFLFIDNFRVFTHESLIGSPPTPIFDITKYGAIGDGKTLNTQAIQAAIDACSGTGGSVYIPTGTFMTGTLRLKSDMTLFVSPEAILWGSGNDNDYPPHNHPSKSIHMGSLKKALIYAENEKNIHINGGGTIDGNGSIKQWKMNGSEWKRPILFYPVKCNNISIQNVYFKDAAMWCLVPLETNNITIRNIYIDSRDYGNRDGIDLTNTQHVLIENCTLNTDDDIICPKSGIESGVQNVLVRNCYLVGSVRANGIKFGTASYGQFRNMQFEDILIKNCDKSAIALESVDGAKFENIIFKRVEIENTNSPFYIIIGKRQNTPHGSKKAIGSIKNILFEDITAKNLNSTIACPISGLVDDGKEYLISNLTFNRCNITFRGGISELPKLPPEMGPQYPECNIWGNMPAYGYFIRHAVNVQFINSQSIVVPEDKRPWRKLVNVKNLKDTNVTSH